MKHKIFSVCLLAGLLLLMSLTVSARSFDADAVGSISIKLVEQENKRPVANAPISVYYVASVERNENNSVVYTYTADFETCGFALDDPKLAAKLDGFVEGKSIYAENVLTDGAGKAVLRDLPLGLYFVKQTAPGANNVMCMPFLVTVPSKTSGGYEYDVDARPKADVVETTDITIEKVWNVDDSARIAKQVTVQLLRDGAVIKTAVLSEENGWRVVYDDMPRSDAYSVMEIQIPEGFTATYSQNGDYDFIVTNSASLPQTGQLVWPIPVLTVVGLLLLAVGVLCVRKSRGRNA